MRRTTVERSIQEVEVLKVLSQRLTEKIHEGYSALKAPDQFNDFDTAVSVREIRKGLTDALEEVASRGYGRVVYGEEYDDDGQSLGATFFRLSQANAGFPDHPIRLIARNSPIGSRLASCTINDEISYRIPRGERSLVVTAIIDIDGMANLLRELPDARLASFQEIGASNSDVVRSLRRFVEVQRHSLEPDPEEAEPEPSAAASGETASQASSITDAAQDPSSNFVTTQSTANFWNIDDTTIVLSDEDEYSLGSEFFTRTTLQQEQAIHTVRGLAIVHGVAGSGKTSVALGRLKFFANFRSGENVAEYSLKASDWADFDSRNMMGFVLNQSLVSYLEQTAEALELKGMKIQDFDELLNRERNSRGVFGRPFKKASEEAHPNQKTVKWLSILDSVAAKYVAEKLDQILSEPLSKPTTPDGDRISAVRWNDLVSVYWHQGQLRGRIRALISDLSTRRSLGQREFLLRGTALELDRRVRLGENEIATLQVIERRVLREAVENVQLRMFRVLNPQELFAEIFRDERYKRELGEHIVAEGMSVDDLLTPISLRIAENKATDDDVVNALCLNALCCEGFERDIKAIRYLHTYAEKVGVFIDEYQDFSELQVFLMGYKALSKYWLVTIAGDPSQRLHDGGLAELSRAFPQIPGPYREIMLERNMRQPEHLARLSQCFRALTDTSLLMPEHACHAPLEVYTSEVDFAATTATRILDLPKAASVAVICSTQEEAERWYGLMRDELDAGFRNPMISDRAKLTTRYKTHFTTALEAKGLEFDAVVVPDISAYNDEKSVERNSLYVAVSRPRHAILLGCGTAGLAQGGVVARLINVGHLVPRRDTNLAAA